MIKKFRVMVSVVSSICLVLVLVAGPALASEEEITLVHASSHALESFLGQVPVKFGELLEEATNGRMKVKTYPAGQLGTGRECMDLVEMGETDLFCYTPHTWEIRISELGVFGAPYLLDSIQEARAAVQEGKAQPLIDLLERLRTEFGVRTLFTTLYGVRHLTTANTPVYKPADAKGLRIRVFPSPVTFTYVDAFGATAIPVPWVEIMTALATGAIDGQENPAEHVLNYGMYDFQNYMMLTGHVHAIAALFMNEKKFQSLDAEDQGIILDVAEKTVKWAWKTAIANDAIAKNTLRKKMTVIDPDELDIASFKARAKAAVMREFADTWADLYLEISEKDWTKE